MVLFTIIQFNGGAGGVLHARHTRKWKVHLPITFTHDFVVKGRLAQKQRRRTKNEWHHLACIRIFVSMWLRLCIRKKNEYMRRWWPPHHLVETHFEIEIQIYWQLKRGECYLNVIVARARQPRSNRNHHIDVICSGEWRVLNMITAYDMPRMGMRRRLNGNAPRMEY